MCGVLVGVVLLGVLCGETRVSGIATASTGQTLSIQAAAGVCQRMLI